MGKRENALAKEISSEFLSKWMEPILGVFSEGKIDDFIGFWKCRWRWKIGVDFLSVGELIFERIENRFRKPSYTYLTNRLNEVVLRQAYTYESLAFVVYAVQMWIR